MRTISIREPIVRALVADKACIVGRNWPGSVGPNTLGLCLGPAGVHVSKQGKVDELRRLRSIIDGFELGTLTQAVAEESVPHGHVVGSSTVIGVIAVQGRKLTDVRFAVIDEFKKVGVNVAPRWVQGWQFAFPEVRWLWLFNGFKHCKPTPWKGVMSEFPVPEPVFKSCL